MNEKDRSLEFLRVLSCILVIVIHVANYYCRNLTDYTSTSYFFSVICNSIARISVPIFFMISGALLLGKKYDKEKYIKKLIKFFIIIIVWNLVYYVWNYFVLDQKVNLLTTFFEPTKRHLWFMYAYIGFYIVSPFIQNMLKNLNKNLENYFIVLWMIFSGLFYIIKAILSLTHINTTINYPIPLIQGTYYLGYFVVGYVIYKRLEERRTSKYNRLVWLLLVLSLVITISATFVGSNITNSYFEVFFAYRAIPIMMSSLCVFYLAIVNKNKFRKNDIFEFISPYTLGIYLSHGIFLNLLTKYVDITYIHSTFGIIPISVLLFTLSLGLCYLIKKIPLLKQII